MITIPLTQGYTAIVDDADKDLAGVKWSALVYERRVYTMRTDMTNGKKSTQLMHRIILGRVLERELLSLEKVDHKKGIGLNNSRENLRLATHTQNMQNRSIHKANKSGYKGVFHASGNSKANPWQAAICVNKKRIHLGCFATPEEAHEAYKIAAVKYHGEFARFD